MRLMLALGALGVFMTLGMNAAFMPPQAVSPDLLLTATLSPTPATASESTLTPEDSYEDALANAGAFTGTNEDWQDMYPDGFIHAFDDETPMVFVPAGCFTMGITDEQIDYALTLDESSGRDAFSDEIPPTRVCFAEPFWIDLHEVTQADFARLDGQAAGENYFDGDNRPRDLIKWSEARDFCELRGVRLPTEAEWEYAARGPDSLIYPWGNTFVADNTVYTENSNNQTAEVGSLPAGRSWVGAYDLIGNVWEWVSTLFDYYPYPTDADGFVIDDGRENPDSPNSRVLRGGSWTNAVQNMFAANRNYSFRDEGSATVGFRCVRDVE